MADYNAIKQRYDSLVDSSDLSELSEKLESISKLLSGELKERLDAVVDGGYKFVKTESTQLAELAQLWREKAPKVESILREDVPELEEQVRNLRKRAEIVLKEAAEQANDEAEADEEEKPSSSRRLSMSRDADEEEDDKPSSGRRLSMSGKDDDDDEKSSSSRRLSMSREDDDEDEKPSSGRRLSMSGERDDDDAPSRADAELAKLDGMIEKLQEKADQIQSQLSDVESDVSSQISKLTARLSRIEWMLEQLEESGLEFGSGESVYLVDKAEWIEEHKRDGPDGFLYLTNQRVIFEQREKVGKRLGMFGGKKVQDILWEFPVTAVEDLKTEDKGMFGGKDVIHFRLNDQAHYADLSVVVKGSGDNKEWSQAINEAKSGNLD